MHIICTTKQAASRALIVLMAAGHRTIDVYGLSPEKPLSPSFTITLPQPLSATLRAHIEQILDTQVVD
jgi:hypothetical protein